MKRSGRAGSVWHLPQTWQNVGHIRAGRLQLRNVSVFTSGNRVISELWNCCHYFLSNPSNLEKVLQLIIQIKTIRNVLLTLNWLKQNFQNIFIYVGEVKTSIIRWTWLWNACIFLNLMLYYFIS
jgi:hypothetical protein